MYSSKINDPAFKKYIKDSKRWAMSFAAILATIAVTGFFIYGQKSSDMDNPQAIFIGLLVGGMFLSIGFFSSLGRRTGETWDGVVTDKTIKKKAKHIDPATGWVTILEYTIKISGENGKQVELKADDDDTRYNYYQIGDRVRHHKGLNSFEKYDKSKDSIVFCSACASLNNIEDDKCFRCKCPLLK